MMMMVTGILLTMRMMLQGGRCPLCCDQELYEYELHEQYLRQVNQSSMTMMTMVMVMIFLAIMGD